MTSSTPKLGELCTTLATWVHMLDDAGHTPDHPELAAACVALREAIERPGGDADAMGKLLVAEVRTALEGDDLANVQDFARRIYGEAVLTSLGDDRAQRVLNARSYGFRTNMPWLAYIVDRFPGGELAMHWVMVEHVTDAVRCMDPFPWDDHEEEYTEPLIDFCVKWELAGAGCLVWEG